MCLPYIKPRADPDFRQDDQLWASAKLKIKEIAVASIEHRGAIKVIAAKLTKPLDPAVTAAG